MKLINLIVGMFILAPMAVSAQSISAGGNYRGTFIGGGQTTAMLQARLTSKYLNVTFEVSSRGGDGGTYNQVFSYNSQDRGWSTRSGGGRTRYNPNIPSSSPQALAQARRAYDQLSYEVQQSLDEKGNDNGLSDEPEAPPLLPRSPIPIVHVKVEIDTEWTNIH